ncbi:MAG TPA: transglycosylase SLT domain-containing protein [Methylomirabilota bacterium]
MRRWASAACLVSVVLLGAAPAGVGPDLRDRFAAALAAQQAGDWQIAAKEFGDPAWAGTPLEDYALLLQAESLQRQGDSAAARPLIAQAADRKPETGLTASALVRAAGVLSAAGDPSGAVALLRRVLSQYPDHPDATRTRYALGEALIGAGDQTEAARVFSALWLQSPASYGDVAERQLKALADAGVTIPVRTPAERAARADRLLSAGLLDRARTEAEAVLAEKPAVETRERALRVVMNASRRAGRDDAAMAAANEALSIVPAERRAAWLLDVGRLRQRRDRDAAIATLDRLVRDYPKSQDAPDALRLKAEISEAAGKPVDAEKAYVKLMTDYPDDDEAAYALWRLGWMSWFRNNHPETTARWGRLHTSKGGQSLRDATTYWLGRAWERRGDRDQANRLFTQLVRDAPRTYYGVLAARRVPAVAPSAAAFAFPADPLEALQGDARFARAEALRGVGLRQYADEELDEITRTSVAEPKRLYALSAAYVGEERYHMALRILRRYFLGVARSAAPTPREFQEMFYPLGWKDALTSAADRASVDPYLVAAVVREESSFHPGARSRVGARGLMQLMPDTGRAVAQSRQIPFPDAEVLDQPVVNLELGSTFLAGLMREFGDARLAAAAYNAGPTRVREWWTSRRTDDLEVWVDQIPYNETRAFVKRVMLSWEEYRRVYGDKIKGDSES